MAHKLVSSNKPVKYASDASCNAKTACDWNRKSVLKSWAISLTKRWNGNLRIKSSVDFWYFLFYIFRRGRRRRKRKKEGQKRGRKREREREGENWATSSLEQGTAHFFLDLMFPQMRLEYKRKHLTVAQLKCVSAQE
jgi:hypothetical protein